MDKRQHEHEFRRKQQCRITLPMRHTHFLLLFFCLFVVAVFFLIGLPHSGAVHSFSRSILSSSKCYFTLICFIPKMLESFSATLVLFDSLPLICILYDGGGICYPQYMVYAVLNDCADKNNKTINKCIHK